MKEGNGTLNRVNVESDGETFVQGSKEGHIVPSSSFDQVVTLPQLLVFDGSPNMSAENTTWVVNKRQKWPVYVGMMT